MAIKSVYTTYFQKSLVFLYPALGIRRGGSVTPISTFMSWKDKYAANDRKLVCLYHVRNDEEYKVFEKSVLMKNPLFEKFEFLEEEGKGVYIFNFSKYAKDWDMILAGKYSKISPDLKSLISKWMAKSSSYSYVNSYLYPHKYYDMYSEFLGVDTKVLKETVELCPHPDMEKETLVAATKDLRITKNIT